MKPRKSFGHEGAERFHGRMGGAGSDRFGGRDDRRLRDRDDRDGGDRRTRNLLDHRTRDQESDDADTPRRNGLARGGKSDPWFKDHANSSNNDAPMSQRERIEKAKSWRDRDPDDRPNDRHDRNERPYERRWDRDRHSRIENDPEWLDEPAEEKTQGHTEEDFKKFMEAMKAAKGGGAPKTEEKPSMTLEKAPAPDAVPQPEQKVASAPAVETGPDKFFAAYGNTVLDTSISNAENKEATKPKAGKSSRFMALMASQEESRAKTEPPTPAPPAQPSDGAAAASQQQSETEKVAFARLLQQLQRSAISPNPAPNPASNPAPNKFPEPAPFQELQQKSAVTSPEPFQQYANDRRDQQRVRTSQHSIHDILSPRPVGPPVQLPPVTRPEQALQDLLTQRHHVPSVPNQANARAAQNAAAVNSNTEFLMRLMQSHREAPEPPRTEQLLVRMPQPTKQLSLANMPDREQDYQRDRRDSQRQQQLRGGQGGGPPGFLDDGANHFHPADVDTRPPPQPTQILQRPPPPPGLDHQIHPFHMGGVAPAAAAQMQPTQRPMIPPPGLMSNNGPRNVPMPGVYPPNFPHPAHGHGHGHGGPGPGTFLPGPPGGHPHASGAVPQDGMAGPAPPPGPPPPGGPGGPRSMQPPPGFFGGPPPPAFMPTHPGPPPGMGAGFQGPPLPGGHGATEAGGPPNGMGFGGVGVGLPSPFDRLERMGGMERMDRRGMMPPGYRGP